MFWKVSPFFSIVWCIPIYLVCFCFHRLRGYTQKRTLGSVSKKILGMFHSRSFFSFLNWSISSVQFSRSVLSDSLRPHESQHARPTCPSPTPGVHPNSCASSQWCHPDISSSLLPFASCPQSLPASESFPMSQLFASDGQSIGVSASSISPSNEHPGLVSFRMDWLDFLTVLGLPRVFSNTTVQKHQFFGAHLSSQSNSHIHRWPLEKP